MEEKNPLATKRQLERFAQQMNDRRGLGVSRELRSMNPNHHRERMKRVEAEARREMEAHRRHRKAQREAAQDAG